METATSKLQELLSISAEQHKHLCPRQVLGVRMGMLAAQHLQLELPQTNKRLFTIVETDGCFADGVSAATGCEFGRRTLRLMDYGKVAATFIDTRTERAVRISPRLDVRDTAVCYAPNSKSRWHTYLEAYQVMPNEALLLAQSVTLNIALKEIISRPGVRATCEQCGEEIINEREVMQNGRVLCRGCAEPAYYNLSE
jgi:formylmethanofuran dehydrogenase subunit E